MIKWLTLFFILLPPAAFATKARVNALGNSVHLIDEQAIFSNPLILNYLGSSVSFESGIQPVSATTVADSSAEALLTYKLNDDRRLAFALGHQDRVVIGDRYFAAAINSAPPLQQNPIDFLFSQKGEDFNFAFGVSYSNFRDEVNSTREKSSVIRLGYELGAWQIFGKYSLQNQAHYSAKDFEGSGYLDANINYFGESVEYFLNYATSKFDISSSAGDQDSDAVQNVDIGFISSSLKEENDVFWGLQIKGTKVDCSKKASAACAGTYTYTRIPFLIGFEAQAESWLTLRASVTQSIFLNQVKDEIGFQTNALPDSNGAKSDFDGGPGNTTVAAGVGLTFGKAKIDGLLKGSVSQSLNQVDFINQLGIKYNF